MPSGGESSETALNLPRLETAQAFRIHLVNQMVWLTFPQNRDSISPQVHIKPDDPGTVTAERMLIQLDDEFPNVLRDNILYYIAG